MQGLLHQVVIEQPEKPFEYFHKEIGKIKKEMEESNVCIYVRVSYIPVLCTL